LLYCIVTLFIYNIDHSRSEYNSDFQVQVTERDIMEHKKNWTVIWNVICLGFPELFIASSEQELAACPAPRLQLNFD